jgi:hypothetical protein
MCVREHFQTVKKVYDRATGTLEYVGRDPDDPATWEVICGLSGSLHTKWRIGDYVVKGDDGGLIARDTPIPGKIVTLDCYDGVPHIPSAPKWRRSVWFPTSDNLFCRVPKGLH